MVNRTMWGLTVLERNIRELHRLGFIKIYLATTPALDPLNHLHHSLPAELSVLQVLVNPADPYARLRTLLQDEPAPILLIEGHALNDRRVLRALLAAGQDVAAVSPTGKSPGVVALVTPAILDALDLQKEKSLRQIIEHGAAAGRLLQQDLTAFDPYIENLRREVLPYILKIENQEQFREAETILKQTVHKGVNDFVAKYIHPPLEFGIVRLIAHTKISPNQITAFWLILAALAVPLFMQGYLLAGLILAAVSGILDGVDGKLARLTLRFSKTGDLLDHVGNTIFDAIWYLALGWHFSGGDPQSPGAMLTYLLVISYAFHRIVPGLFRAVHHHEIYDYGEVDKFVRMIGARMNNNIWLLLVGVVSGYAKEAYGLVCIWMGVTAIWYILRFLWVSIVARRNAKEPQMTKLA